MKISIITATLNSGATLRGALESLLAQTYTDIEHIVVDGLSTDNTMDIVRELEPKYHGRLRYVSEKDSGLYDAMNKGIAMATGDVVGILNSDDFYTANDVLSRVAEAFSKEQIDAVYGDIHFVNDADLTKCVRYYSSAPFRPSWMRLGFMPAHPSFYCRRTVYQKYGTFDTSYKVTADFENLLRLIFIHRIRTKYIPKDFVTMRMGGVSTSGIRSHRQIMQEHQRAFKKNGVYSNPALESFRYLYKIFELGRTKMTRWNYRDSR